MGNKVVVQEKPVREQIREQKRAIDKSIRNIEREKRRVEADEKKMKAEIKKMAKAGQHVINNLIIETSENASQRHRKNARSNRENERILRPTQSCGSPNQQHFDSQRTFKRNGRGRQGHHCCQWKIRRYEVSRLSQEPFQRRREVGHEAGHDAGHPGRHRRGDG